MWKKREKLTINQWLKVWEYSESNYALTLFYEHVSQVVALTLFYEHVSQVNNEVLTIKNDGYITPLVSAATINNTNKCESFNCKPYYNFFRSTKAPKVEKKKNPPICTTNSLPCTLKMKKKGKKFFMEWIHVQNYRILPLTFNP